MIHGAAQLLAVAMAMAPTVPRQQQYPFAVGERAEYQIKTGIFSLGSASMEVNGIDTVRGRGAFHFSFVISGSDLGYHIHDTLQSWVDTARLHSLRYQSDQHEGFGDGVRRKTYEIFPDHATYRDAAKPDQPSVDNPLDDVSFLYFVRTQKLEVDSTYSYTRYFKPESNPVTIKVLRREIIHVPLGEFPTIVVQPIIKTSGLFSKGGEAQLWISDDSARIVVQLRTKLPIPLARLTLQLKSYRPYAASPPRKQ